MPAQNPGHSARHINAALTNFAMQVKQGMEKFMADEAVPRIPVMKQSDYYFIFNTADMHADEAAEIAPGDEAPEGGYDVSNELYLAKRRGFRTIVTEEDVANADDVFSPFEDATAFVKMKALLNKEGVTFGELFKTGTWTGSTTGADITPTNRWDQANSDPVQDILEQCDAMEEKTGIRPNKLILGRKAYTALKTNDNILSRIRGGATSGSPAMVMRQAIASLFELDMVYPVSSIKSQGKEGDSAANRAGQFIVNANNGLLLSMPSGMIGRRSITAAVTFVWSGMQGANGEGMRMRTWRMESRASDYVQAETAFTTKITDVNLGTYFTGLSA